MVGTISGIRPLEISMAVSPVVSVDRCTCSGKQPEPSRIVPLSRMHYAAGNPLSNGLKVASPRFGFLQRDFAISDCHRRRERRCAKTDFLTSASTQESYNVELFFAKFVIQLFPAKWPKQVSRCNFSKFSTDIILIKFSVIKLCESEITFELNAKYNVSLFTLYNNELFLFYITHNLIIA